MILVVRKRHASSWLEWKQFGGAGMIKSGMIHRPKSILWLHWVWRSVLIVSKCNRFMQNFHVQSSKIIVDYGTHLLMVFSYPSFRGVLSLVWLFKSVNDYLMWTKNFQFASRGGKQMKFTYDLAREASLQARPTIFSINPNCI